MKGNFDEDTFGELIQPPNNHHPSKQSSSNTKQVKLSIKKSENSHTEHISSFFKLNSLSKEKKESIYIDRSDKARSKADTKDSNMENSGSSTKTAYIKNLKVDIKKNIND